MIASNCIVLDLVVSSITLSVLLTYYTFLYNIMNMKKKKHVLLIIYDLRLRFQTYIHCIFYLFLLNNYLSRIPPSCRFLSLSKITIELHKYSIITKACSPNRIQVKDDVMDVCVYISLNICLNGNE